MPRNFGAVFFVFVLLVTLFSCKDNSSVVGLDVQPAGDQLNAFITDTTTLISYTQKIDSLQSNETPYNILGVHNDPVFGITRASFYMQFLYSNANPDFGTNAVLDSVVLSLHYDTTVYGKLLQSHVVSVYELNQKLNPTAAYYSNQTFSTSQIDLANEYLFVPKPVDSVSVWWATKKEAPQLRIRLNDSFGKKLLANASQMTDTASFFNLLKGFYIKTNGTPGPDQGAILHFLNSTTNRIMLFYHNDANDSLTFSFPFTAGSCARVNHFEHDYSTAPSIANQLSDSTQGQNLCYVQAGAGLRVRVKMPFIKNYIANNSIGINKAELVVKADPGLMGYYPVQKLNLYVLDSIGGMYNIIGLGDYITPTSLTGGYQNATKEYRFNITTHIQYLLTYNVNDYGYVLSAYRPNYSVNRVVVGGPGNTNYKMKLVLTYTELP